VFSDVGLSFLQEADPEFFKAFVAHHERCDYMEIVHRGTHVQVHGNHFSRTARITSAARRSESAAVGCVIREPRSGSGRSSRPTPAYRRVSVRSRIASAG